ncbi:hypothetical protein [Brevundimonas sp.]|jgi:RHH-type rel operon transcriptional repressor/antitoxin RelB|uniref:type II toxin-antitoxin system RelB family antitoxin n=1 Tax=Brevundimonas sp. TaxID=1871086 RepID=UPI003782EA1E
MIHVDLNKELEAHIRAVSATTDKPLEDHVTAALIRYFEDLEDVMLSEKRLAEFEAGEEKSISLDDVLAEFGLAR